MGQRTRITMGQCWPNVMHPTQLSHVKTRHRCTLAQRWANVLIPTGYRSDCQWQNVNVGEMLGQRCTSNSNRTTLCQRWSNIVLLSGSCRFMGAELLMKFLYPACVDRDARSCSMLAGFHVWYLLLGILWGQTDVNWYLRISAFYWRHFTQYHLA